MISVPKFKEIPLDEFQRHADRIRTSYLKHTNCADTYDYVQRTNPTGKAKPPKYEYDGASECRIKGPVWYENAHTFLRQEIYRYAQAIERRGFTEKLKCYLDIRDSDVGYRIREPDVFEFATRLVNVGKREKLRVKRGTYKQVRTLLFKMDSTQTRLIGEMKFAAKHNIHWRYVGLFTNAVGGYDTICANGLVDDTMKYDWMRGLTNQAERHRIASKKKTSNS